MGYHQLASDDLLRLILAPAAASVWLDVGKRVEYTVLILEVNDGLRKQVLSPS